MNWYCLSSVLLRITSTQYNRIMISGVHVVYLAIQHTHISNATIAAAAAETITLTTPSEAQTRDSASSSAKLDVAWEPGVI